MAEELQPLLATGPAAPGQARSMWKREAPLGERELLRLPEPMLG